MSLLLLIFYWLVCVLLGCEECHGQGVQPTINPLSKPINLIDGMMPPTNVPEYFSVKQIIPNPNPQPMGDWTNITLAWNPSPSPKIDHYNLYLSPTLKPWVKHIVGSTTNLSFKLYIGGTLMGFPGVSAVNKSGIESGIQL